MPDHKHLFKRGGVWTVRFRLPEKYGGGLFQRSLGTDDITTARKFRDLYVMPFLAGEDLFDATNSLIDKALQLGLSQDKRFEQLKAKFSPETSDVEALLTLRAAADHYLAHIRRGQVSPATLQSYNSHLAGFLRIVGEDRPAQSITKQDITAYRDRLLASPVNWMRLTDLPPPGQIKKTVSPAQVSNALAYVRGFFQWLIDDGLVEAMLNPAQGVKVSRVQMRERRGFTKDEVVAACNLPMPAKTKSFDEEAWRGLPLLARYTGRLLEPWHTGVMTRRSAALDALAPEAFVEVHPTDAEHLGVAEGAWARCASRRGGIVLKARVRDSTQPGQVLIPMHFREAAANVLTNPAVDPFGKIPTFKYCAVRLTGLGKTTPAEAP